jgi:hypothetical protein
MNHRLAVAVACVLGCALALPAQAGRKQAPAPTLGSLATRSAPIDRAAPVQATVDDATRSYEAFLQIGDADPALKAQALRRLGDLRLEQAAALAGNGDVADPAAVQVAGQAMTAYRELLAS